MTEIYVSLDRFFFEGSGTSSGEECHHQIRTFVAWACQGHVHRRSHIGATSGDEYEEEEKGRVLVGATGGSITL